MKKNILLFFVLISGVSYSQTVKTISATEIKEVKVYLSGAQIIREINTAIDAGTTQLSVEGLSEYINNGSITITGTGDATLLSVVSQMDYLHSTKKSPKLKMLQDSLDELNHSVDKLNDLSSVFLSEIDMLNANKSVGGANVGVDIDNLKEIADFYRERLIELKIKLLDNKTELKKLNEHIKNVSEEIALLSAEENKPTSTILITIDLKKPTNLSLEVSYIVSNAGWTPLYDVRAMDTKSNVQLVYKANVFQSTGEEWKNVKLMLSTGNPAQNGVEPTLNPWYLNFYQPVVYYTSPRLQGVIVTGKANGAMENKAEEMQPEQLMNSSDNYVTVTQNQLTTDFNIAIPYTIPSDGKKYLVDVQTFSLPAEYIYSAVPKLDRDAFLLARITGWDDLNLLSGEANVYFEGSFVGNSVIDTRNTKDTLDISLGRDKRIVITREKRKDISSAKFIGGNIVKELNYLITVRNGKKDAIKIVLEDQVPVSKNTDIEVKAIDYDGAEYNPETGKVKWTLDIPAAGTVSKKLNFTVKYPKNKIIEGL